VAELIGPRAGCGIRLVPRLSQVEAVLEAIKQHLQHDGDDAGCHPGLPVARSGPPRRFGTAWAPSRRAACLPGAIAVASPAHQPKRWARTGFGVKVPSISLFEQGTGSGHHFTPLPKGEVECGVVATPGCRHASITERWVSVWPPFLEARCLWRGACRAGRMGGELDLRAPLAGGVGGAEQLLQGHRPRKRGSPSRRWPIQVGRFHSPPPSSAGGGAVEGPRPPDEALEQAQQRIKVTPPELGGGMAMTAWARQSPISAAIRHRHAAPKPSGGVTLIQLLRMLEGSILRPWGSTAPPSLHL